MPTNVSLPLIRLFVALHAIGAIGLLILLITASLSRRIRRDPTWFNFCVSWIISCISYLLLALAGRQTGPRPNHALCLTQASLIYAAPPLTASTTLALVIQLWFHVHSANLVPNSRNSKSDSIISYTLLLVPYTLFIVTFFGALAVGLQFPDEVRRAKSHMYCGMDIRLPGQISAILVAVIMLVTVTLEILIAIALYRNWRVLRSLDAQAKNSCELVIRVGTFTVFCVLSIAVAPVYLAAVMAAIPNVIVAFTPVAAVFVFGTQRDMVHVWLCRKPDQGISEEFTQGLKAESRERAV